MILRFVVFSTLTLASSFVPLLAETPLAPDSNAAAGSRSQSRLAESAAADPAAAKNVSADAAAAVLNLPPLPDGVKELKFGDFFNTPVGPRGLELTDTIRQLDGQRVRILGHMVYEDPTACNSCVAPTPKSRRRAPSWMSAIVAGRMMLTAHPCSVSHAHYGLADDLPPATLFITVPDRVGEMVPFTPGRMLLTGVLSVGQRSEPDGRISLVRLTLDPPPAVASSATAPSLSTTNPTP